MAYPYQLTFYGGDHLTSTLMFPPMYPKGISYSIVTVTSQKTGFFGFQSNKKTRTTVSLNRYQPSGILQGSIDWRNGLITVGAIEKQLKDVKRSRMLHSSTVWQWSNTSPAYTLKYDDSKHLWTATSKTQGTSITIKYCPHSFYNPASISILQSISEEDQMFLILALIYLESQRISGGKSGKHLAEAVEQISQAIVGNGNSGNDGGGGNHHDGGGGGAWSGGDGGGGGGGNTDGGGGGGGGGDGGGGGGGGC